jgi:hypothetical protein
MALVKKLMAGEWFTSKMAATHIIPIIYSSVSMQAQ